MKKRWKKIFLTVVVISISVLGIVTGAVPGRREAHAEALDDACITQNMQGVWYSDITQETDISTVAYDPKTVNEVPPDNVTVTSAMSPQELELRDKLVYYCKCKSPELDYPIPYGSIHDNVHCFNAAVAHAIILTTRDYNITVDSTVNLVEKYGVLEKPDSTYKPWAVHNVNHDRAYWPWFVFRIYERETKGFHVVRHRKEGNHNGLNIMIEGLKHGHCFLAGPIPGKQCYCGDGSVRTSQNGHAICFYKYEDGVLYAKDQGSGPAIPYPLDGPVDMNAWFEDPKSDNMCFTEIWVDENEPSCEIEHNGSGYHLKWQDSDSDKTFRDDCYTLTGQFTSLDSNGISSRCKMPAL